MSDNQSNNKRIAKNTILLYFRMLLLLVVNFYVTRILLQQLGVEDFGLNNVVAGFVAMLGFINSSMTNSIQRFLNYQMGQGNAEGVKRYFEVSLTTQLILVGIMFFFFETIGLWFVNSKMVIPEGRKVAANVVYQSACACALIGLIRAPYNALIVAKEKMDFYAYVSILEAVLRVFIIFALSWFVVDKLSLYGILLMGITMVVFVCTIIYCKRINPNIGFRINYDKKIFKEVLSFSGWNLFGTLSGTVKSQGINVIMNLFFGVAINAARGVAFQVLSGVQQFVGNFQVAINPQIVQSYSANDRERYFKLTYLSSKISLYMMWILTLPILFCIDDVLAIWLGEENVPLLTDVFVIIILFTGLFDSLGSSLSVSLYATGNIKKYQIVVSSIKILVLPISYLLYTIGFAPAASMYVSLILAGFEQLMRVKIWCNLVEESPFVYVKKIVGPALLIILVSSFATYTVSKLFYFNNHYLSIISIIIVSLFFSLIMIAGFGLSSQERVSIVNLIKTKIHK